MSSAMCALYYTIVSRCAHYSALTPPRSRQVRLTGMATATNTTPDRITFETSPDRYHHWKLAFDGPVATLSMDVQEDAGCRPTTGSS